MFVIQSSDVSREEGSKVSTRRNVALRSARMNGAAVYLNASNGKATLFFVDRESGRIRQCAKGMAKIIHTRHMTDNS